MESEEEKKLEELRNKTVHGVRIQELSSFAAWNMVYAGKHDVSKICSEAKDGWLQECMEIYDILLDIIRESDYPDVLMDLSHSYALFLLTNQQCEKAEKVYEEALNCARYFAHISNEYNPELADVLNELAYAYFEQGKSEQAISSIEEAINIMPENAHFYDTKGEFLLRTSRPEEALKMWEKVVALEPDFYEHSNSVVYKRLHELGLAE